jgi:hypothetical protein
VSKVPNQTKPINNNGIVVLKQLQLIRKPKLEKQESLLSYFPRNVFVKKD